MQSPPLKKSGFTVIELLVVMMLLALLSTVGAMNYIRYRERNILENAAERLASDLKSAKTAAINGTGTTDPQITFTSNTYTNYKGQTTTLSNRITFNPTPLSPISYSRNVDTRGNPSSTSTLTLSSSTFSIQITFDTQGNPTLGKPNPR